MKNKPLHLVIRRNQHGTITLRWFRSAGAAHLELEFAQTLPGRSLMVQTQVEPELWASDTECDLAAMKYFYRYETILF